jgi:FkbM family methyltransferase
MTDNAGSTNSGDALSSAARWLDRIKSHSIRTALRVQRLWTPSTDLASLNTKIDLMWRDIEFIRTHSSSYVGNHTALTHLADETPIFVNSDDYGGPTNLIHGGRYEESNLAVLMSYARHDTVFIDIGANLGFFAVQLARRIFKHGRVHAFEPHPFLSKLLHRSIHLNGLNDAVRIHNFGLSDANIEMEFGYPDGHLGGGSVSAGPRDKQHIIHSTVRRLDDVMGDAFTCDLMKIDVEGHELAVLLGMPNILQRSADLKILFEKLGQCAGYEDRLEAYLHSFGYKIYHVRDTAALSPVEGETFRAASGYFLAVRQQHVGPYDRNRFNIYPPQLEIPTAEASSLPLHTSAIGKGRQIIFHGPYWFLHRGVWKLRIHGANPCGIEVVICARFGIPVKSFSLPAGALEAVFIIETDLKQFEVVGRGLGGESRVSIHHLELERLG